KIRTVHRLITDQVHVKLHEKHRHTWGRLYMLLGMQFTWKMDTKGLWIVDSETCNWVWVSISNDKPSMYGPPLARSMRIYEGAHKCMGCDTTRAGTSSRHVALIYVKAKAWMMGMDFLG
ncbi:hypothetical protein ACLOJK_030149, partial [Asimina triloba]